MLITLRYTIKTESDVIDEQDLAKIKETMAGVRDPAFWKRFSIAVHLDEEKGHVSNNIEPKKVDTTESKPALAHT